MKFLFGPMKFPSIYQLCRAVVLCLAVSTVLSVEMPRAYGQADTGRINGTVTDSTGAAIPNATITLVNPETGLKLSGTSNGSGELNIPAVPAGTYNATATAAGFSAQTEQITIAVTQNLTLNFKLQPGQATTSIEVTGAAALVDTTDATLGETIQGSQITELPLNGRNALNLALLTPGVTQGPYGDSSQDTVDRNGESGSGSLSVNGARIQANNFILDGVDNNDGLQNDIVFFPPVEATQEFQVTTSVAPAQYGRAGGALVIASIRSGTNQIHGSAFEYYRSGKFDSNPNYRFQDAPATPNPSYNRNQFGGAAGMPILKDKLFIFGDYAAYREAVPENGGYHTVPTPLMRQGNFSELLNPALASSQGDYTRFPQCVANAQNMNNNISAYSQEQIYDPQTCKPFPGNASYAGNVIPLGRQNTAAVNYLNDYPMPSRTDRLLNNYYVQQRASNKYNTFDARLDWHPGRNDQVFLRFSYDNSVNAKTSVLAPTLPAGSGSGSNYVHARGYDLGSTHVFSSRIVNEVRIAYNRDNYGYQPPNYGQNVSANLGIVNANRNIETSGGALIGGTNSEIEYTGDYGLFAVPENTYELTDTVNLTLGKHVIQTGGTLLLRQVQFFRPLAGKGFFGIAGYGADYTGYEPTELLVGGTDYYQIGAQNGYFRNNSQEDALFVQDDWRIKPRLTLNLGFRWDLLTWPYELHNQQAAFNASTGTIMLAGQNGISRSIVNQDYGDFAPRLGFAYALTPNGHSSLHGGYGIFYFPDYGGISNQLGQQPPFGGLVSYNANNGYCVTFTGQLADINANPAYTCPGYTSTTAVTTPLPAPGFPNFNPNSPPQGTSGNAVDVNNKHARMQDYNLQLQQQLGRRDVFSMAYVGMHSGRLSSYYNANSYDFNTTSYPFENLGGITLNRYDGISNYNGLQLHYEHRATDLVVTGSYTWSHALDDSPGAFLGSTVTSVNNPLLDYGNSNQDVRHNASASALYYLPFGRGKRFDGKASRLTDLLIGGFQLNLTAFLQSGQPADLSIGSGTPSNRPDLVGALQYPKQIAGYWFNPNNFASKAIPTIQSTDGRNNTIYTRVGTAGRNMIYGPSARVVNFAVQKNLHLTDHIALELHGDAFNILNTPQFADPNTNMGNLSNFGMVTGTKGNSNRQIQLASRLTF